MVVLKYDTHRDNKASHLVLGEGRHSWRCKVVQNGQRSTIYDRLAEVHERLFYAGTEQEVIDGVNELCRLVDYVYGRCEVLVVVQAFVKSRLFEEKCYRAIAKPNNRFAQEDWNLLQGLVEFALEWLPSGEAEALMKAVERLRIRKVTEALADPKVPRERKEEILEALGHLILDVDAEAVPEE